MTHQIADLLAAELDAKGVVVVLEATHTCMTIRGIRKPGSRGDPPVTVQGYSRSNLPDPSRGIIMR